MAEDWSSPEFRADVAHPARMYDYYLGGTTLFDGLELVSPGLVQLPLWRPGAELPADIDRIWLYAGLACKPPVAASDEAN